MKISRDGVIPQIEPVDRMETVLVRLGGAKRILQQANFPMQAIVLANTSMAAWSTTPALRGFFHNDIRLYAITVTIALTGWMTVYYAVILGGEQKWGQTQSQRTERSPLKQDTEAIREQIDGLVAALDEKAVTDGGATLVVPECGDCRERGQPGRHKGEECIKCPSCDGILYRCMEVAG